MATGSVFAKKRFFGVSMATLGLVTKAIQWNFSRYKWLAYTLLHNIMKLTVIQAETNVAKFGWKWKAKLY